MNRQVPKRYCLIGDGKVARHMAHYFDLLGINYTRWFRSDKRSSLEKIKQLFQKENTALKQALLNCDHVLILISDDQIESFIESTPELKGHSLIHFSGALTTPLAVTCHPLMTFNHGSYHLDTYTNIPFVHELGFDFKAAFPQLANPNHKLNDNDQSLYHAYCVMAGNFSQMMWRALGKEMKQMGLPNDVLHPFLLQNTANFIASPDSAATGPLERGDGLTIEKHMKAINDDDLKNIYAAFLAWQKPENTNNKKATL